MQQGSAQPHVYPKQLEQLSVVFAPANLLKLFHESVDANFRQIANLEKASGGTRPGPGPPPAAIDEREDRDLMRVAGTGTAGRTRWR